MKKISYIICLTAILCSCNNELPIDWSKNRKKVILNKIGKELIYTLLPFTYCMKKKSILFF